MAGGIEKKGMEEKDFTKEGSSEIVYWLLNLCLQKEVPSANSFITMGPLPIPLRQHHLTTTMLVLAMHK